MTPADTSRLVLGILLMWPMTACSRRAEEHMLAAQEAEQIGRQMDRGAREIFEIDLPPQCEISTEGAKIDFEVFHVVCRGVGYGGVYAGNHPDMAAPRSRTLRTQLAWPQVIQGWSAEVPGHQAEADRLIASLRLSAKAEKVR